MESPIFFCFLFKGHICYCKSLEITRRSVEAIKKENFCPLKKGVLLLFVILRIKKIKAGSINKMKKKTNIRVVYIYDYKIQLLIKENICNLQQYIVPLFLEQLLSVRDINKLP